EEVDRPAAAGRVLDDEVVDARVQRLAEDAGARAARRRARGVDLRDRVRDVRRQAVERLHLVAAGRRYGELEHDLLRARRAAAIDVIAADARAGRLPDPG